ncbi:hypothetical protein D3C81_1709290 [compost metagenome]
MTIGEVLEYRHFSVRKPFDHLLIGRARAVIGAGARQCARVIVVPGDDRIHRARKPAQPLLFADESGGTGLDAARGE